ncbi:GntR family transcriptional regulator [Lichenibacterium dinghuense]|uniref:GntR family transcriptional regulator n=1 Tax=Lichenibacterium dinghuense TaxID=2895977 RepID=UPI001F00E5BD|nr:GntR family transcriptional regulator [Lichenibacterium sp. 6Y81]
MPPHLAVRFTAGELSALSVVAAQVARHGRCDLALDHIASLAGVGRTTVRNALAEARRLGLLTVEVRRLRAFRNDTNVVRIASPEWQAWISMRRSAPGQGVGTKPCAARGTGISFEGMKGGAQAARRETRRWSR